MTTNAFKFSPAIAVSLIVSALMVVSIATGIASFFGWYVGITLGLALSYVFSTLAKNIVAPVGSISRTERSLSAAFALSIFILTLGLSYSTLYARVFAQASALGEFQQQRLPIQHQLETVILASAEDTVNAFKAWSADSTIKAAAEKGQGGSCPAKLSSTGRPGAIAKWRELEAGTADDLYKKWDAKVSSIRTEFNTLKVRHPADFNEMKIIANGLNELVEQSEALARGSYNESAQKTLETHLASEVTWPNGDVFKCGDTQRDELIQQAQIALVNLTDLKKNPPLHHMTPAIDISNPQELVIRGLLRSGNAILATMTFGRLGNFADDSLMLEALKTNGLVNRETIGFFLAALIEVCVIFTAFLAVRSGQAPFPFDPVATIASLKSTAEQQKYALVRWAILLLMFPFKLIINLFFAKEHAIGDAQKTNYDDPIIIGPDPIFPHREIGRIALLLSHLFSNHDGDYLIIPNRQDCLIALTAARALVYQQVAILISQNVSWHVLSNNQLVSSHLNLNEDTIYAVFKLAPSFAQAMRLQLLMNVNSNQLSGGN